MSNKLEDLDKSMELASQLEGMKAFLMIMDVDYIREMSVNFYKQADFQDSAAVLNPMYNPVKQELLRKQAKSLSILGEFITLLKEADELKREVRSHEEAQSDIMKLFM
jgi:hypothetical protein